MANEKWQMKNRPRVALVHDWLVGGGAELVVLELHRMFPEAPIYSSYCTDEWRKKLNNKVVTGWLQNWPFPTLRKYIPPLRAWWFSHIDLSDFDLVISSSGNGEAMYVKTPSETTHINYCHSPTHFYWRHYDQYLKEPGFGFMNPIARLGLRIFVSPMRKYDRKAAQRPDYFIANSTHIQKDIQKYYGRESVVIHPPVDIKRFTNISKTERKGFLVVGRQVPYKKIDIAIKACNELGLPLTVVGRGPEHKKLVELAGSTITFDTNANDEQVARYMASAEAFIFCAEEDFGITPVEAMAAGTPVVAYRKGGALDYIKPGSNGIFFSEQNSKSLAKALQEFQQKKFDANSIRRSAEVFSRQTFRKKFLDYLNNL
jgi:glycosyltransferase involved in cell wall biosynthesis